MTTRQVRKHQAQSFPTPAPLATVTGLTPKEVQVITEAINPLIADAFALYIKTKNFHWHLACIGYLGHPFEKETPWAYVTLRFLSFRWYLAIDRGEKCFSCTRENRRACAANHQGRHAKAA